jgi:hypothetical protein
MNVNHRHSSAFIIKGEIDASLNQRKREQNRRENMWEISDDNFKQTTVKFKINEFTSNYGSSSGQTQYLLPYVISSKDVLSFTRLPQW